MFSTAVRKASLFSSRFAWNVETINSLPMPRLSRGFGKRSPPIVSFTHAWRPPQGDPHKAIHAGQPMKSKEE